MSSFTIETNIVKLMKEGNRHLKQIDLFYNDIQNYIIV